jgi:phosphoribosyl-AMP cyclohydrolase
MSDTETARLPTPSFQTQGDKAEVEQGCTFQPKFGSDGLIPAIVTDAATGMVLMFAHMNADALALTLQTGAAHFWSRSRGKLWKKGEDSGNVLVVREVRTDCDQDVVWLITDVAGQGVACHTGAVSCFYRRVAGGDGINQSFKLLPVDTET